MDLLSHLPTSPDEGALLDGFGDAVAERGLEMYPAQEEAIIELIAGSNVILNTPTGSGKSLVAEAAHFIALARNQRSIYTAPIKALVSEKFFALCRAFGSDLVGMITGDGSVNPDAPIICCTAEILAYMALQAGDEAEADLVIMDEFHFYADPQRGWAWQVPILELAHTQFVLMSATLGDTSFFRDELTNRTGRETALVRSAQRPVPLDFEYRRTTLHTSLTDLLERDLAPVYVVHFTQRAAAEAAQAYLSLNPLTKDEKRQAADLIGDFRFDSPFGRTFRRFLVSGVGIHHAGLLPKYRLLVEKLAQAGLLKIICGTDTLGVGINVPIRSVLFTQLCKYDGSTTRILRVREFHQIAGRAGRRGFDDQGTVWVQAPAHVVDNERAQAKAAAKGRSKIVRSKPPERGYAHWDENTFNRLVTGDPEPLTSSFDVNHQMIMSVLNRPGDGCAAVKQLLTDNHEPRKRRRAHIRRAISIYRSLVTANLLEFPDPPDDLGRRVRVNFDLHDDLALHQPLSLWALNTIASLTDHPELDDDLTHALAVVTVVESVQENPAVVIAAQLRRAKDALMAEMKAAGVEYEERMERLATVEPPRPMKDWLYDNFNTFRVSHPWVGGDTIKPKSVVRDLFERAMTFGEYVSHYGLKQSEGVVLRYLSDVYRALVHNVPSGIDNPELDEIIHWLGTMIRTVDSSLIDEWERLQHPDDPAGEAEHPTTDEPDSPRSIVDDERAFARMVRNAAFRWIEELARGGDLVDLTGYWDEYDEIMTDGDARHISRFSFDRASGRVEQVIHDPDGDDAWRLIGQVDLDASRAEDRLVINLDGVTEGPALDL